MLDIAIFVVVFCIIVAAAGYIASLLVKDS